MLAMGAWKQSMPVPRVSPSRSDVLVHVFADTDGKLHCKSALHMQSASLALLQPTAHNGTQCGLNTAPNAAHNGTLRHQSAALPALHRSGRHVSMQGTYSVQGTT
jgi:hypothetical protein